MTGFELIMFASATTAVVSFGIIMLYILDMNDRINKKYKGEKKWISYY